jgi:Ca2+-binding RTX toxin-like protein
VQGFGTLDYALASSSLFEQVTGTEIWNINADEPSIFDYDTTFKPPQQEADLYAPDPFRSSDHDPVLVGLSLDSGPKIIMGTAGNDYLRGTDADEILISGGGKADQARGGGGVDEFRHIDTPGQADFLRILDHTPGEDTVNLGGAEIASSRSVGSSLLITLDGGDRLLFSSIDSIDDINFVDDVAIA